MQDQSKKHGYICLRHTQSGKNSYQKSELTVLMQIIQGNLDEMYCRHDTADVASMSKEEQRRHCRQQNERLSSTTSRGKKASGKGWQEQEGAVSKRGYLPTEDALVKVVPK